MGNTISLIVPQYTDEFGNTYENLTFKVGVNPNIVLSNPINGGTNPPRCSNKTYFSMRKAIIYFTDGTSMEVPIPSLEDVPAAITAYKTNDNIECVALKGERWRVIPPAVLGNLYATTAIAVADQSGSSKFFYNYQLSGTTQSIQILYFLLNKIV